MRYSITLLSLLITGLLYAQPDTLVPADGPYLSYEEDGTLLAQWAWPEERRRGSAVFSADTVALPTFRTFRPEMIQADRVFQRESKISFKDVKKLAVVSDIHGQYDVFRKLLTTHGVMDEHQRWAFGEGHFVIVGDIFDRGPQVTEILWLVHNLQLEAEQAGGRVHFLLGNHETMIMDGDVRYINERYLVTGGLLRTPYQKFFDAGTYLGRWLRSRPLAVEINGIAFVHGGISTDLIRVVRTLTDINNLYHDNVIDNEYGTEISNTHRIKLLEGRSGPLWYRGYFMDKGFEAKDMARILKKLRIHRMIVGHTSFTAIQPFFDGKLIAVDSSIKFGSMGEILLIEDGDFIRGGLLGERTPLFLTGMR